MSIFWMKHPFITLVMVGMVCVTIVDTVEVIVNGKRKVILPLKKEKNTQEEIESVEE